MVQRMSTTQISMTILIGMNLFVTLVSEKAERKEEKVSILLKDLLIFLFFFLFRLRKFAFVMHQMGSILCTQLIATNFFFARLRKFAFVTHQMGSIYTPFSHNLLQFFFCFFFLAEDEEESNVLKKNESPICWIRIDPEYEFIHQISFKQPGKFQFFLSPQEKKIVAIIVRYYCVDVYCHDNPNAGINAHFVYFVEYMWLSQLEQDVDVYAQKEALIALRNFSTSFKSIQAISQVLENK